MEPGPKWKEKQRVFVASMELWLKGTSERYDTVAFFKLWA